MSVMFFPIPLYPGHGTSDMNISFIAFASETNLFLHLIHVFVTTKKNWIHQPLASCNPLFNYFGVVWSACSLFQDASLDSDSAHVLL